MSRNTIHDNGNRGINIIGGSTNISVFLNSFGNNSGGNAIVSSSGPGILFNTEGIGNFWTDYTSRYPLAENDGVVWNTPYTINTPLGIQDFFPLVNYANVYKPIYVNNDAQLDAIEGITGNGTEGNPYIIQDFVIGGYETGYGIIFRNIAKHVIIQDFTIIGALFGIYIIDSSSIQVYKGKFTSNDNGIMLVRCNNISISNTTLISNRNVGISVHESNYVNTMFCNITSNTGDGIKYDYTFDGAISNNTISSNMNGISIEGGSSRNEISNNTIQENARSGIFLTNVVENNLTNNKIMRDGSFGVEIINCFSLNIDDNDIIACNASISMTDSINCTLNDNKMNGSGLAIEGESYDYVASHAIQSTNTVNGKQVYYFKYQSNLAPSNFTNAGQVFLINCSTSLVSGVSISNINSAMKIFYSRNITVHQNEIFMNKGTAIESFRSSGTIISNNSLVDNEWGIYSLETTNETMANNTITGGIEGIWIDRSNGTKLFNNQIKGANRGISLDLSREC
nr:NosD domain-containing protein [Candidatus Sigynarchaeota archaeon]